MGVDRDGRRQTIVLTHRRMLFYMRDGVYRFDPAPSNWGNSVFFFYSTAISVVTSCDALGFLAYPAPIGVAQIAATMTETYEDIRSR